jgi:hypothetical protein
MAVEPWVIGSESTREKRNAGQYDCNLSDEPCCQSLGPDGGS